MYALAADMGGMGFISTHHAEILHNNSLINLHTLEAARINGVQRYLYSSSACIYPEYRQTETDVVPLKESDAYPAQPQDAYGWEKLFTELLCTYYADDYAMETRIVRFHNIYGPFGTYDGGREKAPAAICRKVAHGRGRRQRSRSGATASRRGHSATSTTASRASTASCSPTTPSRSTSARTEWCPSTSWQTRRRRRRQARHRPKHIPGPQGVRGRNSDNTLLRKVLGLGADDVPRATGLGPTYRWIEKQADAARDRHLITTGQHRRTVRRGSTCSGSESAPRRSTPRSRRCPAGSTAASTATCASPACTA